MYQDMKRKPAAANIDSRKNEKSINKQYENMKNTDIAAANGNFHSRSQSMRARRHDNPFHQHPSNTNIIADKEILPTKMKPKSTEYVMCYKVTTTYPSLSSTKNIPNEPTSIALVSQDKLKNNVVVNAIGSCISHPQQCDNFEPNDSYQPNRSGSVSIEDQQDSNVNPTPPTAIPPTHQSSTMPNQKMPNYSFIENNPSKTILDVFEQSQISHEISLTKPQPPQHQYQKQQQQQFDFLNIRKSINILVLGETGVGKSTWINAFVNYLSYSSLEDAMTAKSPTLIIPTQFSMFDKNYQQHQIRLGGNSNDQALEDESESVTKNAKVYLIEHGKYDIHIVDTPGINDTHGHDDQNIQDILKTIAPFKEIHAICFLFKANECRLSQTFRNNISKLLHNLSKSALANACIMFTNARGTFFKPGDTMVLLKRYFRELQEREGISISISDNNTFCLDNEAFRFLCAHFSGIQFGEMEIKTYSESWIRSSIEVIRLLNYAASLRPHETSETLSINETRTWILQLINPIIKVLELIQTNLHKLKESVEELETTKIDIEKSQKRINIQQYSLKTIRLRYPQIVCSSEKCIQYENIGGKIQKIYKTICHDKCRISSGNAESIPDGSIKKCKLFLGDDKCKFCDCSWMDHRRIFYFERYVPNPIPILITQFDKKIDALKVNQELLQKVQEIIDAYSNELNTILNAMATFSLFLYQNGICQKSDIFEAHLRRLIETEQKIIEAVPDCDEKSYHQLTSFLKKYQKIRENIFNSSANFTLSNLQILRNKILTLPLTGSKISQMFDIHVEADFQDHEFEITRFWKPSFEEQNVTAM